MRSLHFEPVVRDLKPSQPLRIGRFNERPHSSHPAPSELRLAFKSKVVSRTHAEIWCEPSGQFFIRDTKSSSGTFLNHIRLSAPNHESRPHPLKDGDVVQLGVDYQGGTEEMYRCVKIRVELGRRAQNANSAFKCVDAALYGADSQRECPQPAQGAQRIPRSTGLGHFEREQGRAKAVCG